MILQDTYKDITEIGSGGGGTVYKAYHIRMEKYVVLKKIHDSFLSNSIDIRRELDILKNLRHSYLPTVLDFIEDDGSVYTVMDYIQGESFESLLQKSVHFTQAQLAKYARQLGEVLVYLHGQNPPIVHGDIKPANLILTPQDDICLIDFNISQIKGGIAGLNMGYTPGYAAPEQIKLVKDIEKVLLMEGKPKDTTLLLNTENSGTVLLDKNGRTVLLDKKGGTVLLDKSSGTVLPDAESSEKQEILPAFPAGQTIDERADIYSVGATLYALLIGHAPDENNVAEITSETHGCSEGMANLINRCMAYQPEKRFRSASEFLRAVLGIAKVDKRYKHLILRQELAAILCMAGIAASVILAFAGHERIGKEKKETYEFLINQMEICEEEGGEQARFDEIYQEAIAMFPEYAAAYYQRAWYLYEKRQYEEMTDYLLNEVMKNIWQFSEEDKGDIYFLLAEGYMELEKYADAADSYSKAINCNAYDASYYADYAISLAKLDKLSEASGMLEEAVRIGGANDRILLAQGEINGRRGLTEEAEECFRKCLNETEDNYIMLRAYVMWNALYDGSTTEQELLRKAEVLEEGTKAVSKGNKAMLLELLAQTFIDLGDLTQETEYYRSAVENLQEIAGLGWDTYITHNNIGILYEKIGEFEAAGKEFKEMLSSYGEDYRIYKRLAFLELDIQAAKDNSNRDYARFLEYYDAAVSLFADSGIQSDFDMEMSLLEQAYEQLKEGNWL